MADKMDKVTKIILTASVVAIIIVATIIMKQQGIVKSDDSVSIDFTSITMEEAKDIFATEGDYIILDVRRADEFSQGHIPGAINIANEDIIDTEPAELKDKNQTIYVYCRSGNRSKQASAKLAAMGYTSIVECGGIINWTGEVEK